MRDPNPQDGQEINQKPENGEPEPVVEPAEGAPQAPEDAAAGGDALDGAEPEAPEPVVELTAEERLQQKLDDAQVRLRTVSKAYTDLQAENTAFRERIESQARFKRERQAFELARGFFDPVQNLKRSLEQGTEDPEALVSGLQMVLKQFMTAMEKLGMQAIPGVGSDFDPTVHEALAVTPVLEPEQDGKVLMVHSDGYTVNGKVLVASQVVIGKYQENQGEA